MGLNIKNDETYALAKSLASLTGETMTQAVTVALRERLESEKAKRNRSGVAKRLMEIGRDFSSLPVLDDRSPDEIIGYDEHGIPR